MSRYTGQESATLVRANTDTRLDLGIERILELAINKQVRTLADSNLEAQSEPFSSLPSPRTPCLTPSSGLTPYETHLIHELHGALSVFPDEWSVPSHCTATSVAAFFNIPELYFRSVMAYSQHLSAFRSLPPSLQLLFIKRFCRRFLFARSVFLFCPVRNGYPMVSGSAKGTPTSSTFIPLSLFKGLPATDEYLTFYRTLKSELSTDRTLFALLSAHLLFRPHCRATGPSTEYLTYTYHKYSRLLRSYLHLSTGDRGEAKAKYRRLLELSNSVKRMLAVEADILGQLDQREVPDIMAEVYTDSI